MGLGGGTEISQYRVRFSHDLLMMNVMFETSVLSELERFACWNALQMVWLGSRAVEDGEVMTRMAHRPKVCGSSPSCRSRGDSQARESDYQMFANLGSEAVELRRCRRIERRILGNPQK